MKKRMAPGDSFLRFSERYSVKIEASIRRFFKGKIATADFPLIGEMYSLLLEYCGRNGKRVRPLVFIAACLGFGGSLRTETLVRIASALELMHSFLLIQDDIIDRSDLRRGGKALHLICDDLYGKNSHNDSIGGDIALILGDVLFTNSLEILSNSGIDSRVLARFMNVFARTFEITAWGQVFDIMNSNSKTVFRPREMAMQIGMLKTAYYTIYYPMLMGYILAGGNSRNEEKQIRDFALPLGLAFQIRDDMLGVFGNEQSTGKPSDSDILEGKMTLLVSGAIEMLDGKERERFISLFTSKKKTRRDIDSIRNMIDRSGSRLMAEKMHGEQIQLSLKKLSRISINDEYRCVIDGLIGLIARI